MEEDQISTEEILNNLNFCVFDLETTGGNQSNDKIIEIGLVIVENLEITVQKNYLIQPEIKIPEFIQKLTSITPKDVKDAPLIEDVIDEILEIMGDRILVAHNTSFDIPFFNSVLKRLGREQLTNKSICTNLMTKYLIPNLLNSNLNYMSSIFGINHQKAHRALDDAKASAGLLIRYLNIFKDKGIKKINHLYYPRNRYELDRFNFKKSEDGENLKSLYEKIDKITSPSLFTLKGENGVILFALPNLSRDEERQEIKKQLESNTWEVASIKIFGTFSEALINFNNLFVKIIPTTRDMIIDLLWIFNLPNIQRGKIIKDSEDGNPIPKTIENLPGDFIVVNHLVPDQLIIWPITSMHPKSSLIFRFPSHKKKLLQYINSKTARITNNKLKKTNFSFGLNTFIIAYLLETSKKNEVFMFKKSTPKKKQNEFFFDIEKYLFENNNTQNYPKKYI